MMENEAPNPPANDARLSFGALVDTVTLVSTRGGRSRAGGAVVAFGGEDGGYTTVRRCVAYLQADRTGYMHTQGDNTIQPVILYV